ncbi:hypothetical protein BJH93_08560 [Kocuria polaris]|nr:hypothetical protein [Kocuria polaris]
MATTRETGETIDLRELLRVLQGSDLVLRSQGPAPALSLTSPSLYDPFTPLKGPGGGILLGLGLHPEQPTTAAVIEEAARAGFAAVVLKDHGLPVAAAAQAADAAGIALLSVSTAVDWRQLDALLDSALGTVATGGKQTSPVGVGDLFALANAIAAMVGGATAIENLQEQVLAYSTLPDQPIDEDRRLGILGRQVPYLPVNAEQYAAIFRSSGAVHIKAVPPALDRLAIAVRAGQQPLGSIWVVDADGTLDANARQGLERAADMAALHLLRARSAGDLARAQRAELLRRLLDGGDDGALLARQLGLSGAGPYTVVAFQPDGPAPDEVTLLRVVDLITAQGGAFLGGAHCVLMGTTVYALFASAGDPLESQARRLVASCRAALGVPMRAAAGSAVDSAPDISRSRHDADLVLLLLAGDAGLGDYASARGLASRLTLLDLATHFRHDLRLFSPAAAQLLEHDAEHGTHYARTLRAYLDCSRDSARTAETLMLHQNTLRYRLRRLEDLFSVNIDNPEDTLILWLSLHLKELL